MTGILNWGAELILWSQQFQSPITVIAAQSLSWIGSNGYLFLVPLVVFAVQQGLGLRLSLLLSFSLFLNALLRNLFALPRPFEQFADIAAADAYGYGFPGSHAQLAVVFWGVLALHVRHWGMTSVAIIASVLIGCAPLVLGVNYPTDIIAGWSLGLALLAALWRWEPAIIRYFAEHGRLAQTGGTLAATTFMWLLSGLYLNDVLLTSSIGFFLGCAMAGILHPPGLDHPLSLPLRAFRFVFGMILVLLMIAALQRASIWLDWSSTLSSLAGMALLGGWLIGGVPILLDSLTVVLKNRALKAKAR